MLNEERVVHMTRLAMFEAQTNRKLQPATKYLKRDYVTLSTIGGIILGTIIYGCMYAGVVVALFSTAIVNITLLLGVVFLILGVILYAIFMFFYVRMIRKSAGRRYNQSKELVKVQRKAYIYLENLYEKEEPDKASEGWE